MTAAARRAAAGVLLGLLAAGCGGGHGPSATARPTASATGGDLDRTAARAWTATYAVDARSVQLVVRAVQQQLHAMGREQQPTRADYDRLGILVRRGHATVAAVTADMAKGVRAGSSSAQDMVLRGVTELRDALGKLDDYLRLGGPRADVAAAGTDFATGCSDWNSAVIILWSTAGETPPTVPRL